MYIPEHFKVSDKERVFSFVEKHSFGQLISNVEGRFFSTRLPFLLSEDKTKLFGHLSMQNPQHFDLEGQEVLVTFDGPHGYISPSWYESPGVPTWNYQSVHIYGRVTLLKRESNAREIVDQLTNKYESKFDNPWTPRYKDSILKAIVAFEIRIGEFQCQYKLSQNRSSVDRAQVIEQLKRQGSEELATAMMQDEF